jgi:hypothetical protein
MNDTTSLHLSADDEARIDALLRDASARLHTTFEVELPATLPWDFPIELAASNPDVVAASAIAASPIATQRKRTQHPGKKRSTGMRTYKRLAVAASLLFVVGGVGSTQLLGTNEKTTFSGISNTLPGDGGYGDIAPEVANYPTPADPIPDSPTPANPADSPSTAPILTPSVTQDVIYTATMRAETKDIDATANQIRIDTAAASGTVFADTRDETVASLTLEVPPQQFDDLLRTVATRAKVTRRSMQASDVTAEGVDLQARLSAATTSRDRVAALLAEATNLQNIVSLEGELRNREMEVEQISGQLRVLRSQVGMGTISIELTEPETKVTTTEIAPIRSRPTTPGSALRGGWNAATTGLEWMLIFGAAALPFTPLVLLAWGVRVVVRRRRMTTHNNSVSP